MYVSIALGIPYAYGIPNAIDSTLNLMLLC